jgi:hypothetical protein
MIHSFCSTVEQWTEFEKRLLDLYEVNGVETQYLSLCGASEDKTACSSDMTVEQSMGQQTEVLM